MSLYQEGFTQNREISWLKYNERVLEEALDNSVPLFERLKYIEIFDSNLEEFFQVRIGSLIEEKKLGEEIIDEKSGLNTEEQLDAINHKISEILRKKNRILKDVENELSRIGIIRCTVDDITGDEENIIYKFFVDKVKRNLDPYIIKDKRELYYLDDSTIHIISKFKSESGYQYGITSIPKNIPKICVLDYSDEGANFIKYMLTEDIIKYYVDKLFFPYQSLETHSINIARTAEVSSNKGLDPLSNIKEVVKKRKYSAPDKVIVDGELSIELKMFILSNLGLTDNQMYFAQRISVNYVSELAIKMPSSFLRTICFPIYEPFDQTTLDTGTMIDRVCREDILSCYPYDSMQVFLQLLKEASTFECVEEIRITIYRLSTHTKIINYLIDAAKNGKKVNVLIELRARFDEEKNIDWAEKLSESGCNVYYGSEKYKVHSKLCQIVLKNESGRSRYITQLSTGNYNERTASTYTDFSLITYNQKIGRAVNSFWKDIVNQEYGKYDEILTSPKNLKIGLIDLIKREAKKGSKGRIFIKVNSLSDEKIIEALMDASCAGCKIYLLVRGICCLIPGIDFCTENIVIVNLVGRFLEHSRVYIFGSGRDELVYISSADLMTRNMDKRVELACPIYDEKIKNRIKSILYLNFKDNVKGRIIDKAGNYRHKKYSDTMVDSQSMLMNSNS